MGITEASQRQCFLPFALIFCGGVLCHIVTLCDMVLGASQLPGVGEVTVSPQIVLSFQVDWILCASLEQIDISS